jgi:hypothetical protein
MLRVFLVTNGVCLLSDRYQAKCYRDGEVEDTVQAVNVALRLGVRAPRIHHVVELDGDRFCVMDRIDGRTLEESWAQLGWFASARLALRLRRWVHRLWSVGLADSELSGVGQMPVVLARGLLHACPPVRARPTTAASFIQFWNDVVSAGGEIPKKSAAEHAQPA